MNVRWVLAFFILGCGGTLQSRSNGNSPPSAQQTTCDGETTDPTRRSNGCPVDESRQRLALPADVFEIDGIGDAGSDAAYVALDAVIGNARYVGLGETVHTSGGFYQTKQRILRYLVERHGFRAFAIESPWTDVEILSRYVEQCDGDPEAAVRQALFPVWASREMVDLVRWVCEWNGSHPQDRVAYFGFDIQQPSADVAGIRAFLERVAPSEQAALMTPISRCDRATDEGGSTIPHDRAAHEECLGGIAAFEVWLDQSEAQALAASSQRDLEFVHIRAIGLRASEMQSWHRAGRRGGVEGGEPNATRSFEERDRGMGAVLRRMHRLIAPSARVVVWAHNGHLAQHADRIVTAGVQGRSMGTFLREHVGAEYVAIALLAFETEIDWPQFGRGRMQGPPHAPESVEALLEALGRPYLFVPTSSSIFAGNVARPLAHELQDISEQYQALFFLHRSPPMQALSW